MIENTDLGEIMHTWATAINHMLNKKPEIMELRGNVQIPQSPQSKQIAGVDPLRESITISNTGSNPIRITNGLDKSITDDIDSPTFGIASNTSLKLDYTGAIYVSAISGTTTADILTLSYSPELTKEKEDGENV